MVFTLPKLPYDYNALEPHIDEQTMRLHHGKHHQTYVDKVNAALEKAPDWAAKPIEEIIKDIEKVPKEIRTAVRNHGGGHANHTFFWTIMGPKAGGNPTGEIAKAIEKDFGSFENFKKQFSDAALNRFGSGWAWLVLEKGKLKIIDTTNQDSPLSVGLVPVLTIDVWEHSYYLKFQNRRADYIAAWWNVVNWKQVDEYYKKAVK